MREVRLLPVLRDELDHYELRAKGVAVDNLVFTTAKGHPRDRANARQRVILPVVQRADELLAKRVMSQLGHTDSAFTPRV